MIILDTNVISALMHQTPLPVIREWLNDQPELSVWTTAVSVMEIRTGIELLPRSRRRSSLESEFDRVVEDDLQHRVVPFDTAAANATALLMAERRRTGRTGELRDALIAGIVIASHATLATRNTRHFADLSIPLVDPWGSDG